ncbi:glycoside hydrolase family 97 protein, partial [uncultured Muribaculum sp.]
NQDRIKKSHVDYNANTLVTTFKNEAGQEMSVEWQVSDNDVAFRYIIPRQKGGETGSLVMEKEATGFKFPSYTTTFITPQSHAMIGWKRTKPSYEEPYKPDAPMTEKSMYGHGYTFPALFHVGDDGWVLLTETGVDGSYCGSRLSDYNDGMYTIAYPMPEENNGNGSASPGIALPGTTPWRTITVGSDLAPIVETTIPWSVVEPLYEATEPFKPGRGTWSWILWQDNSINYDDQVKFIDLAAEMGYENVLVDNWWDTNIGREGIEKLVKYAHSKGVNLLMWYSSSGWWNDIVQGPTSLMSRPIPRKKEMKWLHDLGIKGIKVDFFGGDKQETMRLYEDILSDANDYGINVIFHGCTMPRGWERLYPNYAGSEAVLASENLVFSQGFCDQEAYNATLHPFIRNAAGCMEYGGTVLNKRLNRGNDGGTTRRTSDAFQLATSILYQNAVQNFALSPTNLTDAPAEAIEFMKAVPTTWDETLYIDGYPGRYVVLARRHGDTWYIAGVSAEQEPLKLKLDLPMLAKDQVVEIYADPAKLKSMTPGVIEKRDLKVKKPAEVPLTILPSSGFVIVAK